jgi:hypothetical protein
MNEGGGWRHRPCVYLSRPERNPMRLTSDGVGAYSAATGMAMTPASSATATDWMMAAMRTAD